MADVTCARQANIESNGSISEPSNSDVWMNPIQAAGFEAIKLASDRGRCPCAISSGPHAGQRERSGLAPGSAVPSTARNPG
jgi:hypothetical protein